MFFRRKKVFVRSFVCLLLCLFVRLFVCSFVCLFVCSTFRNRRHLSKKKSGIHLEKVQRKQKKFKKFILFQMITAQPGDQSAICLLNQIKLVVYSVVYSIFLIFFKIDSSKTLVSKKIGSCESCCVNFA
jgi:hypothetical protein